MTRLLALAVMVLAAPFVAVPRLGALVVVVVSVLLSVRWAWRRLEAAHKLVRDAERGARRGEFLGFVNERPTGRRRSPDDQFLTRAGPGSAPRVLDQMPGRAYR